MQRKKRRGEEVAARVNTNASSTFFYLYFFCICKRRKHRGTFGHAAENVLSSQPEYVTRAEAF